MLHQVLLDQVLHRQPGLSRQRGQCPLLNQVLRQHLGAQNVFFGEFGHVLQTLHTQAQVIELPTGAVQQAQRQTRGENFVFHHLIAHELELAAVQRQPRRGAGRGREGFFPGSCGGLNPDGLVALKGYPGIPAVLHLARVATLVHQDR